MAAEIGGLAVTATAELSRRVGRAHLHGTLGQWLTTNPERYWAFVARVEDAGTFEALSPADRAVIVASEQDIALKYSPDQPRDDHGRFGEGSGGSGGGETFESRAGDNSHIDQALAPRFKEWAHSLKGDEQQAIVAYTESSSFVNQSLRQTPLNPAVMTPEQVESAREQVAAQVEAMDRAMAKASTDRTYVAYRGVWAQKGDSATAALAGLKVGDAFTDKAYVSTSLNPHVAGGWGRGPEGVTFRIEIPPGSHAAYTNSIGAVSRSEGELLIHRDARFEVTAVHHDVVLESKRPAYQEEKEPFQQTLSTVYDVKLVSTRD